MKWTEAHLQNLLNSGKIRGYKVIAPKKDLDGSKGQKRGKYGNKKTIVDGREFDSIREAKRYRQLLLLQKAGKIGQLELQVPYELNEGGTHSLKYIADFVYMDAETGEKIVEDAKGCLTKEYRKKRRLMKKIYGVIIKET